MKKILLSLLLLSSFNIYSQKCSIKGFVSSNKKPVEFASIGIKNTSIGATTNLNGWFEIKNIEAKTHVLIISCLGYKTDSIKIQLKENEHKNIQINLIETHKNLDEIVVTGTLKETYISDSPIPIEVITPKLFQKKSDS